MLIPLLLALLTPRLPATFVPPPILMYHRVDVDQPRDAVGRSLTVSPGQFAEQLAYLQAHGLRAISMAGLYHRLVLGEPTDHVVVMTFDDGYADQYQYAVPMLRRCGGSATFYIVTGMMGHRRHLTWDDLRVMNGEGMDIAAHGVYHDDLSLMSTEQQAFQIEESIRELQDHLHVSLRSYAFPSGRFNRATLALLQAQDVPLAVTTDPRYVIRPASGLELTRLRVKSNWTLAQFAGALEGARIHSGAVLGSWTLACEHLDNSNSFIGHAHSLHRTTGRAPGGTPNPCAGLR